MPNEITLSIDTATSLCAVSITCQSRCLAEESAVTVRRHNAVLPTLIDNVFQKAGILLREIDLVAVSIGPGSFTGLRVGLSYAKGLAMGLRIPVAPVETLDALALNLQDRIEQQGSVINDGELLCPLTIARKGEIFGRIFSVSDGKCVPAGDIFAGNSADLLKYVRNRAWIGGEGVKTLAAALDQRLMERYNVMTDLDVSAVKVGMLGWEKHLASPVDFNELLDMEPLYMKEFTVRNRSANKT